jgi:GH15 family glucan-1,4-alpha-glucosidase
MRSSINRGELFASALRCPAVHAPPEQGRILGVALAIEDYALIGDCHTAALVGCDGSIDWLCLPRFDSPSMFAALLGSPGNGRWLIAPEGEVTGRSRSYVGDSFVLRTRWETPTGEVEVIDLMPLGDHRADVLRFITGVRGTVTMRQELEIRFGYGATLPWVRRVTDDDGEPAILAVAGPNAVLLRGGPLPSAADYLHTGTFDVAAGDVVDISLTWYQSHRDIPRRIQPSQGLEHTLSWWQAWADRARCPGRYGRAVRRSLLVLRALTNAETGGIVAAATTSLPEQFGGQRNWDYRYCWLRDAALTLKALMGHGYLGEAREWRDWLLRTIAGDPGDVQVVYGVAGERDLPERELPHLAGYAGSRPVRIGNGAVGQYQGDVLGEVMVALDNARAAGIHEDEFSWPLQLALLDFIERNWQRPDHGIWEVRGRARLFTHSQVMVWAAFDRGVSAVRRYGLPGPVERWEGVRDAVRARIEARGFDRERGTYTQVFGGRGVDAALLQLPQVGFVAPDDPRMLGTVAAIEQDLLRDGLLLRYETERGVDGLPPGENPFLACSFWLVEQYARSGRHGDGQSLMDRLVGLANDVGLLSEEYDVAGTRHAGNTPQALSHLALVRAADALAGSISQPR